MKFKKPCLDCGELSPNNRCPDHQAQHEQKQIDNERYRDSVRKRGKTLYRSTHYRRQAAYFRDYATQCHICGEGKRINDPFTADHLVPSDPNSPLAPAHRSCNSRRGNRSLP